MTYLTLKYIHIMSMLLLFGVGLGSAFYRWMADLSGDLTHIVTTNRHVVLADWIFTTPTVIIQPITGLYLAHILRLPLTTPWIAISLGLYLVAGLCWLPVVWLQLRMHSMAQAALDQNSALPAEYWHYARLWFWLGVPAFTAMLLIVLLMVFKSSLATLGV